MDQEQMKQQLRGLGMPAEQVEQVFSGPGALLAEKIEAVRKAQDDGESVELGRALRSFFSEGVGARVWAHLQTKFEAPACFDARMGALNGTVWGYTREGHRDVIAHLRNLMAEAEAADASKPKTRKKRGAKA